MEEAVRLTHYFERGGNRKRPRDEVEIHSMVSPACKSGCEVKADIFLSYASEDRGWAQDVVRCLELRGWRVWWDRQLPAGRKWRKEICRSLEGVRCIVVLWSRHSVESNYVLAEASFGLHRGILVPVRTEPVSKIPIPFGEIQALDLSGWNRDPEAAVFQALATSVNSALAGTLQIERPPTKPGVPAAIKWLGGIGAGVALIAALLALLLWRLNPGRAQPPSVEDLTAFHDSAGVFKVSYPASLGAATIVGPAPSTNDHRSYSVYFGASPQGSALRQCIDLFRHKAHVLSLEVGASPSEMDEGQWRAIAANTAAAEDRRYDTWFASSRLMSQTIGQSPGEQRVYRERQVSVLWVSMVVVSYLECREGVYLKGSGIVPGSHWESMKGAFRSTFTDLKWSPPAARAVLGLRPIEYQVVLPTSLKSATTTAALRRVRDSLSVTNVRVRFVAQQERASETNWSFVVIGSRVPPRVFTPVLRTLHRELPISYVVLVGWSQEPGAAALKQGVDRDDQVLLGPASLMKESGKPPLSKAQVTRLLGDWSSRKELSDWLNQVYSGK